MNGPSDEQSFDEYLQRGSPVSQQYRALDEGDVPNELDARILARASDAVRSPREKARAWRRWSVPVGLAASTVLVVSVVLEGVQHEPVMTRAPAPSHAESEIRESVTPPAEVTSARPQQPASVAEERVPAPPPPDRTVARERPAPRAQTPPQPSFDVANEERAIESSKSEQSEVSAARSPSGLRYEASDQALHASAQRQVRPGAESAANADSDRRARVAAPPRGLSNASAAYEAPAPESKRVEMDAEQWLDRIRVLRETGEIDEADREWRAFRKAYPQHSVDEDDSARPLEKADSG